MGLHPLGPADRSLARELALGTLRRQGTVDAVLRAFLAHPDRALPDMLRHILHVAIYQLLFMERIPQFAAVNEAVTLVAGSGFAGQRGLVNGILRGLTRAVSGPQKAGPQQADGQAPAARTPIATDIIPIDGRTFRKVDRKVFPDPSLDPVGYLAAAHSLPRDIARRWIENQHSLEAAVELAYHANARAPMVLRVNKLKGDVQMVRAALAAEGIESVPHANGASLVLAEHANIAQTKAFEQGLIQPQDPTATAVSLAADPRPGMRVLDFCAAPGTKTTHIAELMENRGSIVAADVSPQKLAMIEPNCRRLGISIVTTRLAPDVGRLPAASFDLVLVDVPCSNSGVLSRRAEARWQFEGKHFAQLVRDQRLLATAAAGFVKPGGRLVYSTCSIEPEEDSQVAQGLGRQAPAVRLVREQLSLPAGAEDPSTWRDGGYYAIFEAK